MSEIDSNAILQSAARKGKELSICAKITNTEKALEFMYTMYEDGEENQYGMIVSSWGNFNEVKAQGNKIQAIESELNRHRKALDSIMCATLSSFLEIKEQ